MANKKISELSAAGALTGTELIETVQGGVNVKTTTQDIADLGGGGGSFATLTGNATDNASLAAQLNLKSDALASIVTDTGAYTLQASDLTAINAGDTHIIDGDGTGDLTVPLNATVAFPVGTFIAVRDYNNIVATGGVTITGTAGNLTIPAGMTVTLEKTATNTWILHNGGVAVTPGDTLTTEGALINSATSKATPVDADYVGLMDSAASNILKKLSWANIKATLKTYFDTLYNSVDRASTSTAGGTITLDFNSLKQRAFYGSATFSTPKTIAVSNATNIISFNFSFTITDVAAVLTMPATFVMSDVNWDGTDWTPPNTGNFLMGGYYDGTNYMVIIAGPFT